MKSNTQNILAEVSKNTSHVDVSSLFFSGIRSKGKRFRIIDCVYHVDGRADGEVLHEGSI